MPELSTIRAADQRFEPVHLAAEPERVEVLAAENEDRRAPSKDRVAAAERRAKEAARERAWSQFVWQLLAGSPFALWMVVNTYFGGGPWATVAAIALTIALPAGIRFVLSTRNGIYLIPGSIVIREGRHFGTPRLRRYDANTCGMVLSEASDTGDVQIELHAAHGIENISAPTRVAAGFLAGWLSTAPPPTDVQLAELFGAVGNSPSDRAV